MLMSLLFIFNKIFYQCRIEINLISQQRVKQKVKRRAAKRFKFLFAEGIFLFAEGIFLFGGGIFRNS